MLEWATSHGLVGAGPVLYGLCPDDPEVTEESLLRFDACVAVGEGFVADEAVGITHIPPGTYAVGLHRGPYRDLADAYLDVIGRWFPTSGYEPAAEAVVEHYLNHPGIAAECDLLTEVRVRIAQ